MSNDRPSELDIKQLLFRECAEKVESLARAFRGADEAFPSLSRDAGSLVERQLAELVAGTFRFIEVVGFRGLVHEDEDKTPVTEPLFVPGDLVTGAITVAATQLGQRENGPNTGPMVDQYLASVGLEPGQSWCAAFVFWCFNEAAKAMEMLNPVPKTGGVLKMWERAPDVAKVRHPVRGAVFVMDHGSGKGHTGIVENVNEGGGGLIETIEGNTNRGGSRQGDSVWRHIWRPEDGARGLLVGYLDFSLVPLVSRKAAAT